jgi:nitroreductase
MAKPAQPDYPILPAIVDRWSPYYYDPRPVKREDLLTCLEAARWAASAYNEQPWAFLIATREDKQSFDTMLRCLVEANQQWAQHAGALVLTTVSRHFTRNGKPNRTAEHDLGLAMGNFCAQATALGLHVHQMAGIEPGRIREVYALPEGHDPVTAVAIGYAGDAAHAPADHPLAQRDVGARTRKPLGEFVFAGRFGTPAV